MMTPPVGHGIAISGSSYITDPSESWATDFTGLRIKLLGLSTVATHHRSNTNLKASGSKGHKSSWLKAVPLVF